MQLNTRADYAALMHTMLDPLKPLYSAGGACLRLGSTGATYPERTIEMEGFSRPLWALAPYWQGGGEDADFEAIYRRGLAAGTDPESTEYWGDPGDYDQLFVEMAAIACAILEVPEKVWNPLSDTEKQNLARWLDTINHHFIPGCNWLFFMVLVNLALDSVGMPCDMANAEKALKEIDTWYVGDGWYSDGPAAQKPQKDYYIPWAIQYYGVLYSVFAAGRDPARARVFRDRAMAFGGQFALWFDVNGAALPYGRSLGYRFGQCAFYAACVWAGLEPLPLPVMKGIIERNLTWWMQQPIFDRDGLLTIGYCYPQLYMSERYNAPGSPYWGMKAFILLGLPDDAPYWSVPAAPLPAAPGLTRMLCANMLMQRLPDGQLNGYPVAEVEQNEHGQFAQKYGKFVYNTRFGFSAARSEVQLEQAAPDSMLAFLIDGHVFLRRHSDSFTVTETQVMSTWRPFPGITVTTVITPGPGGHTRRHTVENTLPENLSVTAYDCGFAVPKFAPCFAAATTAESATAQNKTQSCTVQSMTGGKGFVVEAWPNTSLYSPNTVIPAVQYTIPVGTSALETKITATATQ